MKEESNMYGFILNMWIMGKVDENFLVAQVRMNRITQKEADMIMATPKI